LWQVRFLPSLLPAEKQSQIPMIKVFADVSRTADRGSFMKGKENSDKRSELPGVDTVLKQKNIIELVSRHGHELVTYVIRDVIDDVRKDMLTGKKAPGIEPIAKMVCEKVKTFSYPSLKRVINATGVVLHTNLGRAPLGQKVLEELKDIILGYSNLEFNLKKASRGERNEHVVSLLRFITGAEDALVVNNNAAAIILALNTFAKDREVIISRGELIEIGGSFRIPEIMAASGAKMVEVGTTNMTHLADYEKAINENTALILKVHKSNYYIKGFSDEVPLKELVKLAHSRGLPVLYDIGSGLLRKPKNLPHLEEPDVRTSLREGADLVTFSGDKLLGGPQAGIITGKSQWVSTLKKAPMMRALRVGKLTLSVLSTVIRCYFNDRNLVESLPLFSMLGRTKEDLKKSAGALGSKLAGSGITSRVVKSTGQCGGGSLPNLEIDSFAVSLTCEHKSQKKRSLFAEVVFRKLLDLDTPILGILRRGEILFDVLTLSEADFPYITAAISQIISSQVKK
jgi:L-seryl-tRNA(Ser) seleniumtransferase